MWVTLNPAAFIAASTASGGGAAAVKNSTTCGSGFFSSAGALSSVAITIGAPQRCVTLWRGARAAHPRAATPRQAPTRPAANRNHPREGPAVAVEHRQRAEIGAVVVHAAGEHVADGEEISAAVVIDHALRIAGGAGGIVERDRVPLVVGHFPGEVRIARREKILVVDAAQPLARPGQPGAVVTYHHPLPPGNPPHLLPP